MKLCVVGPGAVGLPLGVLAAETGHDVVGLDIQDTVVDAINSGTSVYPLESDLADRLKSAVTAGRLRATTDAGIAISGADMVVVLVRLIVSTDGKPDFSALDEATRSIAEFLTRGCLVSYETTVPVGTTRNRFTPRLESLSGLTAGKDFHVAFSPERVRVGRVLRDLKTYPKLAGGLTPACAERSTAAYSSILGMPVITMASLETAEFTKIAECLYRDVNIALSNELAQAAAPFEIDLQEVIAAGNSEPLCDLHQPGVGVGGHCIPVYPYLHLATTPHSPIVSLARSVNEAMPAYAVSRLAAMVGNLHGRKVLVLGLSFRGGVRESSYSPTFAVVDQLRKEGADVRVHDPLFGEAGVTAHGLEWGNAGGDWPELLLLQTDHPEYKALSPDAAPNVVAVLDGRDMLDAETWAGAGVSYVGIGRPMVKAMKRVTG